MLFRCIKDTFLLFSSSYNDSYVVHCIWCCKAYNLVICWSFPLEGVDVGSSGCWWQLICNLLLVLYKKSFYV